MLVHLLDEVTEHLLRDVEVGDDSVLERPDRLDRAGRAAGHALRLDSHPGHVARAADVEAATAAALPVGLVVFAPVAVVWWRVEGAAVPFVVASSGLELAYVALLAAAYRRAELSLVYPLTRGLAPVLVLVVS